MAEDTNPISYEKYNPDEVELVLAFMDGYLDPDDIVSLMKSEEARKSIEAFNEKRNDPEYRMPVDEIYTYISSIIDEFAKRLDKKDFVKLHEVRSNVLGLVDRILDHPEYFEGGLTVEDKLILLSKESPRDMQNKWREDPKGQLLFALEVTMDEAKAVEQYVGSKNYVTSESNSRGDIVVDYVYEMYNALFYPGLNNEKSRIIDEGKNPPYRALAGMKNLLQFSRDLYTALYKSSRLSPEGVKVSRVDRVSTIEAMEENGGVVVSNFSTTIGKPNEIFTKRHTALVSGTLTRGVVAGDFKRILGGRYGMYHEEQEVLIAPGTKVDIKEEEITDEENKFAVYNLDQVERKVSMDFYPQGRYIDPLTPEERNDKYNQLGILLDPERERKAQEFIERLMDVRDEKSVTVKVPKDRKLSRPVKDLTISFDEAVDLAGRDLAESYLEFKEAFRKYYGYMTREVAMEIESSIARANENTDLGRVEDMDDILRYGREHPRRERYYIQASRFRADDMEIDGPKEEEPKDYQVTDGDMRELVASERLQDIKQATETFGLIVGEKDILKSTESERK